MIRSVLALSAQEGCRDAVEEYYREHRILEISRATAGCRSATLWRSTDGGSSSHLVVADWDDEAAYHRWVTDPFRTRVSQGLAELLTLEPGEQIIGALYGLVPDDCATPH